MEKTKKLSLNPALGKEHTLNYFEVESQVKFLQGKVLTIVDASYSNVEQKKAVKSLINSVFSTELAWILQLCAPETPIYSKEQCEAEGLDIEKIEAEAELSE